MLTAAAKGRIPKVKQAERPSRHADVRWESNGPLQSLRVGCAFCFEIPERSMPTYDYRCERCGHEFEAFQGIRDARLSRCPQCGRDALVRLIGAGAGIIFKGSGFYATDYRPKGSPNGPEKTEDKRDSAQKPSENSAPKEDD